MFQSRLSRPEFHSGSPFRSNFRRGSPFRSASPFRSNYRSGSPFPGQWEDYDEFRCPSPYYGDFRRYGDYSGDYPFSGRDCSPWRFGGDYDGDDYSRRYPGSWSRFPGDYGDSMYHRGDYEDYMCEEDGARGRYSERRSRAVSRDRVRFDRSAALSEDRYGEQRYSRQYGARHRSLSPPMGAQCAREVRAAVRARSVSPGGGAALAWPMGRRRGASGWQQMMHADMEMCSPHQMMGGRWWAGRQEQMARREQTMMTADRPAMTDLSRRMGAHRIGWY